MFDYDVAIVGSGFGGSVSALRLTEKGYRVAVIEAGRRFGPDDYPRTNWNLRRFLFAPRLGMWGIQRMTLLGDALVLTGAGVGGGSLVYANTLYEPPPEVFDDPQWADITDWRDELAPHYTQARRMLGATTAPDDAASDRVLRRLAERLGVPDTYHPTEVGVHVGTPSETVEDPYFGGAGPDRTGCIRCGGCMVGCRHGAKNSLDHNYLHLAERGGATIVERTRVTRLRPGPDGGYVLSTSRSGRRGGGGEITAEQVIVAAGVLGTVRLLAGSVARGDLTAISDRLGELVRTNSEAIVGATARSADVDHSEGVAIGSSIHPAVDTHIEAVRYPRGSNALGLLGTLLVDGGGRLARPLRFVGTVAAHPVRFLRSLSVRRWSERSVILLVMQTRDNSLRLTWRATRRGRVRLRSEQGDGEPNPTSIPLANTAAREVADLIDGDAMGAVNEALLDTPVTAHILGGCVIGSSAATGVLDPYQRVHGHRGLHVADASAISTNLGVNPSLTITAQTERAMALWPNRGEPDPRPEPGEPYERLEPIAPRAPLVPPGAPAALAWPGPQR